MARPALKAITGGLANGREQGQFVCTYCARTFPTRKALAEHHAADPRCKANARVSNPLPTKYGNADIVSEQPGEYTLHRTRAATCEHTAERQMLVNDDGEIAGWQCGYCYTVLRQDRS